METPMSALDDEFGQYKKAATDVEQQAFWDAVAQETNQLTPEQRIARQQTVRTDIDRIMKRLTEIGQQLAATLQPT
jgi:hypothetical protein